MMQQIDFHIDALESMKKYPQQLYCIGKTELLNKRKVSIVGSRKPNQYAREMTHLLASKLSKNGITVVSGGAIGVDAIAHKAAGSENTIMVAATGLDKRYPAINKNLISAIEKEGLVLSQFAAKTPSNKYNFVLRNELVVALGDVLIVSYADRDSGTMRSVEYALKMGKKIFVLPHRIGESEGTNLLLQESKAEAIYDIEKFVAQFACVSEEKATITEDSFLLFCKTNPSYEEALKKFPERVFEAELLADIIVKNGRIFLEN